MLIFENKLYLIILKTKNILKISRLQHSIRTKPDQTGQVYGSYFYGPIDRGSQNTAARLPECLGVFPFHIPLSTLSSLSRQLHPQSLSLSLSFSAIAKPPKELRSRVPASCVVYQTVNWWRICACVNYTSDACAKSKGKRQKVPNFSLQLAFPFASPNLLEILAILSNLARDCRWILEVLFVTYSIEFLMPHHIWGHYDGDICIVLVPFFFPLRVVTLIL